MFALVKRGAVEELRKALQKNVSKIDEHKEGRVSGQRSALLLSQGMPRCAARPSAVVRRCQAALCTCALNAQHINAIGL
jgi:hypothetical protein